MTTLRVRKVALTAQPQVKLRVHKASLTAAAPISTKLRVHKASLTAVGGVVVAVVPAITVGPGEVVDLVADLITPGSATWAWRRISGPLVGLTPDDETVHFITPSLWNADRAQPSAGVPGISTLVLGVKATIDGIESPEVRCTVSILPQLSWYRGETEWVGARVAPAS